jgi:ribosomal protein L11 methyltransferase
LGKDGSWPALLIEAPSLDDPPDAADLVAALLDDFNPAAIEDLAPMPLPPGGLWDSTFSPIPEPPASPLRWRVFFHSVADRERAAAALTAQVPSLAVSRSDVQDEDWAARSQRSLTAVRAGRFIVAPPWDVPGAQPYQPHQPSPPIVIIIEPSMGFGTGHHATTRLCLRLLSDTPVSGMEVLDIGTGSGVLALGASLMGARRVTGLDVDRDAIESARHSAALNTLPRPVDFAVGDFRTPGTVEPADAVFANLTGGMLTAAAAQLTPLVRPGGTLILSGFETAEADGVRAAFAALPEDTRLDEDNWVAMRLVRTKRSG